VILLQQSLLAVRQISSKFFIFQQDSALAHAVLRQLALPVSSPYVDRSLDLAIGPLSCLSVLSVSLVYCGQTVGSIKVKLGTDVGLPSAPATLC